MRNIAIIPARGGSKGLPRKNARPLAGAPLISYSIRAAISSGVFDAVVVSTEDSELAAIADAEGALVVVRPAELATDTAPTEPAIQHALVEAEKQTGLRFEAIWLLQPTSPLRAADDIVAVDHLLTVMEVDAVVSVTPDHSFFWRGELDSSHIEPEYDLAARPRRQNLRSRWKENGAIYGVKRATWDRYGVRAAGTVARYSMPADRSLEIDTEADWRLAEALIVSTGRDEVLASLLAGCQAVAFDFDGVMTDNTVIVARDGSECVVCSRSDGWGIAALREFGVPMVVISSERDPVVSARCMKLSIDCVQGVSDKSAALAEWLGSRAMTIEKCVFVGNDENDVECLKAAGVGVVPADAHPWAREAADYVLTGSGGRGAVRELCDALVRLRRGSAKQ